ncbi:hypothetical protein CFC21_004616 [Triticum aestivum]|uniref:Uncharacterized protein n=2 Tax=Triticum aestivum TaxID=4565 RepID=A0A3B5YPN8_WHEAT|nr:hypothetical protein CFC21_004616 [Triticum aestivum]
MASAGAGRGGGTGFGDRGGFGCRGGGGARGGFFARKRQNDDEAGGSGLRSPVSKKQREAACTRGAKSRSAGSRSRAWKTFRRCVRLFDSAIQCQWECQWEAEWAWFEARTTADAEDAVAAVRLLTLWDEYQLQTRIYCDLIYDTIHEGKPLPAEVISSDDNDEGDDSDSDE